MANITPFYNTQLFPSVIVRPLEVVRFRGSLATTPSSGSLFFLPHISNLATGFTAFDSSKHFQANRVSLNSPMTAVISFEDLTVDFLDLDSKVASPSLANCSSSDSSGTCLRCTSGFFFSSDFSACQECAGLYIPLLDVCSSDTTSVSGNHYSVADTIPIQKFLNGDNDDDEDSQIQYFSFFNLLTPSVSKTLKESLTVNDGLSHLFRISLELKINGPGNIIEVVVPSRSFLQYSGNSYLLRQIVTKVTKTTSKQLNYDLYLSFDSAAEDPTSNYLLPIPNQTVSSQNNMTVTFTAKQASLDYDALIGEQFSTGNFHLPIQTRSPTFHVSPYGPFHNSNHGTSTTEEGYFFHSISNSGFSFRVACADNCSSCDILNSCLTCKFGTFFDPTINRCSVCSEDCLECVDHPLKCLQCADPNILIDQGRPSNSSQPFSRELHCVWSILSQMQFRSLHRVPTRLFLRRSPLFAMQVEPVLPFFHQNLR